MTLLRAAQRARRSAPWHRPPTVAEAPKVQCQTVPRLDWNALRHVRRRANIAAPADQSRRWKAMATKAVVQIPSMQTIDTT